MFSRTNGFTLIEIVVVIAILGIVAVTVLPRFAATSDAAHRAKVGETAGAFQTAVTMVRATRRVNGFVGPGANDNVRGFGANDVDFNTNGFPVETNDGNTITAALSCVRLWNGILQVAPTVGTTTASDFTAVSAGQVCTYTYNRQTVPVRRFVYTATTGGIVITNPP